MISVSRLKQTFSALSKKNIKLLEDFRSIFDPAGSYKRYRNILQTALAPTMPYLYVNCTFFIFFFLILIIFYVVVFI